MVKLKTILDIRRAKADGTFSILFRITNYKEVKYIPFGVSVNQIQWDDKTSSLNKHHPNANTLNASISKRFYEIQKAIVNLEDKSAYSYESLKNLLYPQEVKVEVNKPTYFKDYSQTIIAEMMEVKRTGNAMVYQTAVNRVMNFKQDEKLTIEQIDYTFLDNFKRQLIMDGVKVNTIGNYFRSLRAIYNKSIKAKLVDRSLYPFSDIKIKTERTAKRALNVIDLIKVYNSTYKTDTAKWHARNYFLLSFSLRGMSFTDMAYLTPDNIKDGRLLYKRKKTNSKLDIKLTKLAISILDLYRGTNDKYLLPIFTKNTIEGGLEAKAKTRQ